MPHLVDRFRTRSAKSRSSISDCTWGVDAGRLDEGEFQVGDSRTRSGSNRRSSASSTIAAARGPSSSGPVPGPPSPSTGSSGERNGVGGQGEKAKADDPRPAFVELVLDRLPPLNAVELRSVLWPPRSACFCSAALPGDPVIEPLLQFLDLRRIPFPSGAGEQPGRGTLPSVMNSSAVPPGAAGWC